MIPDGKLYDDGSLGAGQVATIEPAIINTEQAGAAIGYGVGVTTGTDGRMIPATSGNIFGVAVRRTHSLQDHLYPEDTANDKWFEGEEFGVLRDGTIAVPVTEDVNMNESAAVTDGGFKKASTGDKVVGVFISNANEGSTARMQTRIQFGEVAASQSSSAQPANASSTDNSNNTGGKN